MKKIMHLIGTIIAILNEMVEEYFTEEWSLNSYKRHSGYKTSSSRHR